MAADWLNEDLGDLLTWSPPHNDWELAPSGSHQSLLRPDHHPTPLPEHHDPNDSTYDNTGARSTQNSSNPLPTDEPPTHLLSLGAAHADPPNLNVPLDTTLDPVDLKINQGFRHAGRERFMPMPRSPPLSIPADTQSANLPLDLIAQVKADADVYMVRLIFDNSFFPAGRLLTRMANDALSLAVAKHNNGNFFYPFVS